MSMDSWSPLNVTMRQCDNDFYLRVDCRGGVTPIVTPLILSLVLIILTVISPP